MVIQTYLQLLVVILQNVGRRQQRAQRTISMLMEFNSRGRSFLFCWADISMAHFDSLDERVTRSTRENYAYSNWYMVKRSVNLIQKSEANIGLSGTCTWSKTVVIKRYNSRVHTSSHKECSFSIQILSYKECSFRI